jgi:aspartate kinase
MGIIIKKFGGTSVGTIERIQGVAALVKRYRDQHPEDQIVVVVSAMAGETNRLIELAKSSVAKPPPRELDVLLATGEQVSISLTAMALMDIGIKARSMDAQQARISTDQHHTNAQILDIDTSTLRESLDRGEIPVVAGFQGVDAVGNITTLGRGGSDITAVALGAALSCKACYIYTDVEGVYSTDPRVCKEAKLLERVSHEEMLELASLGAKVLHPRSVYFAMRYQVPLVVLSTFKPGPGTWIVKEEELMEKPVVTGITHRMDEAKITISKLPGGVASLNRLFSLLAEKNVFIDMITQASAPDGAGNLSFTIHEEASDQTLDLVADFARSEGAEGAYLDRNIAKVSVVGAGMRYHSGVAANFFAALASEDIEVQMISTSEIKISVVIPRKYCEMAVRTLHEAFIEFKPVLETEK